MDEATASGRGITRRSFVGSVALGAAAVALGCEGSMTAHPGSDGDAGPMPGGDGGLRGDAAPATGAPVWRDLPSIQFVAGVASTFSIADYVSDPDGDELTITLNEVPLPAGVTFDAAGKRFVYDGSGPVATTSGHVLTADDGT